MLNLILLSVGGVLGAIALFFLLYAYLYHRKDTKRSLDLVFLQVLIPQKDSKEDRETEGSEFGSAKDYTKITGLMSHLYASLHALRGSRWRDTIFGSDYFSCEYAVEDGQVYFYVAIPRGARKLAEKQISSYYKDAVITPTGAPKIFQENRKIACTSLVLSGPNHLPIRTVEKMESDPLNTIVSSLSKIPAEDGAGIQILCRPIPNTWQKKAFEEAENIYKERKKKSFLRFFNPLRFLGAFFDILFNSEKAFQSEEEKMGGGGVTPMTQERVKAIEEKATRVGFDVIIRLVATSQTQHESDLHLQSMKGAFEQFGAPDTNGLSSTYRHNRSRLVRDYIFRMFRRPFWLSLWQSYKRGEWRQILSTEELMGLYHFPHSQYNASSSIKWQDFKIVAGPHNLPKEGLLLGHNVYRGEKREVRIKQEDRMRHFYLIGKSGTGKSTILEQMVRQDLKNGHGLCLVDPHGDLVEAVLPYIPRERADDVILFDPGDLERPMGLNLLEAETDDQKEFISQEALAIFIKLYGEEIMGPRLQHYFRNGVLTLMADDEEGATLLDIMRLFTDPNYENIKKAKVTNPSVRSFWDKEMAKSGQREKEEIIPYFASKFGPFVTNTQIRNILGQPKSGFDFRDVMDNKKILLVNLSKGKLGDLNAKLLGMIIVSKIQMAAMSRVDTPEEERNDFFLYVDEFQNFVTESFASILSEARKYRLGLIVAHQYISQITQMGEGGKGKHEDHTIKDAVFGNVGSMMCFKIGAQDAETMAKEFQPVFSEQDLINIANYQAYIKLNINNATSRGFSMATIYDPTGKDLEGAEAFRQLSRLKFGRDREFVNREIARRIT